MGSDAFEEIEIFGGEFDAAHAISESDEAEETAGSDEWNANAAAAFVEVIGVEILEIDDPRFLGAIKIDRISRDVRFGNAAEIRSFRLENFVGDVFRK